MWGETVSKKILIIYEKMGMGHLRMANILEDILNGSGDVRIFKLAGSELSGSSDVQGIVYLWNLFIRKNWIKAADILVNFIIRIVGVPIIEVMNTKPFLDKLEQIDPDIIISTADGFNRVLGTYASEKNIPFYIFLTEVSVFSDLVNPYATHICYFKETVEAIRSYDFQLTYFSFVLNRATGFLRKILYVLKNYNDYIIHAYKNSIYSNPDKNLPQRNNARCEVIGPLAEKKHFTYKNPEFIKQKYNIPKDVPNVIIASGSIGGQFLMDMVNIISSECETPLNLLVMCGLDRQMYQRMLEVKKSGNHLKHINIMPFEYTDSFNEFLAVADCLIARPSAGIFIESLINRIPQITFTLATSNDRGAITLMQKYETGEVCKRPKDLVHALNKILNNRDRYRHNIEQLLSMYYITYEEKKAKLRELILNDTVNSALQEEKVCLG
jgi:hypothetical protein